MISVIGCGYWGKNLIKTFGELGVLFSVHDINQSVQQQFTTEYNLESISFEEMLKSKSVIGVVIATTAETHFKLAKQALENNKHVFIEKPICLESGDAKTLGELSEMHSRILMVGHLLQYHDHFKKLKEIILSNKLGKIKKVKSTRKSYGILREHEDVIWSFAPHDISMILSLFKDIKINNFYAHRKMIFNSNTDSAHLFFEIEGANIEIEVDWTSYEKLQRIEVYCEKGIIVFEDSTLDPDKKLFILNTLFDVDTLKQKSSLTPIFLHVETEGNPLKNECLEFINCIKNNSIPFTNYIEASKVLNLLLKAEEKNE